MELECRGIVAGDRQDVADAPRLKLCPQRMAALTYWEAKRTPAPGRSVRIRWPATSPSS
jgi:hypothetical protein